MGASPSASGDDEDRARRDGRGEVEEVDLWWSRISRASAMPLVPASGARLLFWLSTFASFADSGGVRRRLTAVS